MENTMMQHDVPSQSNSLGRRRFLKSASLGAASLALGAAAAPRPASARLLGSDKSEVSFQTGKERREMVAKALEPFRKEVEKGIKGKRVVIKANAGLVKPEYANYSSHPDQLRGILDFLAPIHDREIVIMEGCAAVYMSALDGFENYGYLPLAKEYKKIKFVDSNDTPFTQRWIYSGRHHPEPIEIINLFTDPDVYLISAARMKTHNAVVGTYSLKNCAMGSPVCHWREKRNEKSKMHGGDGSSGGRELSYNLFLVAQMGVQPDLAIIDGVQSIEGDGPWDGTVVDHGVVLASTDFVAADRMASELMGIDPMYMKYLDWCGQAGMGNFDLEKIKVNGPDWKQHVIKYKMNSNFDWQVAWILEDFKAKEKK
jgi:uncharacterized protein (DUF362 family)